MHAISAREPDSIGGFEGESKVLLSCLLLSKSSTSFVWCTCIDPIIVPTSQNAPYRPPSQKADPCETEKLGCTMVDASVTHPNLQTISKSSSSRLNPLRRKHQRVPLLTRKSSQTLPTIKSELSGQTDTPQDDTGKLDRLTPSSPPADGAFGAPRDAGGISRAGTASPPSVFDDSGLDRDQYTEPTTAMNSGSDEPGSYDLKPPPPSVSQSNIEALALRFFSADHLDVILQDPNLSARLSRFLTQYRSQHLATLNQYFEAKKAATAIEYANAVAEHMSTPQGHPPFVAATLDERFEARMRGTMEDLVEEALPAYMTHRLVQMVTESLVKEVTGNQAPIMRELIPSLAEVYCITDPSLPDNPIVYASQGRTLLLTFVHTRC